MRRCVVPAVCLVIALTSAAVVRAQNYNTPMQQYLGWTKLSQLYGGNLAFGSNVSVAQVEAGSTSNGVYGAYANTAYTNFSSKTMTPTDTYDTTDPSGHATTVGSLFYGNTSGYSYVSMAPNIGIGSSSVQMYGYSEFLGSFLLDPGVYPNTPAPYGSSNNARVASHAYNIGNISYDTATRMDYLEERDQFIQVVPNNFYGELGDTMNSVVVVSTDGAYDSNGNIVKTDAINDASGNATIYTAGRVSPTVTGPWSGSPSNAIGQVAGLVGLLVSEGEVTTSDYSFSTPSTTAVTAPYSGSFSTYTKAGYTVQSGSTADVVKAAVMAGALRYVPTYTNGATVVNGITDYRATAADDAPNGLDYRWGAGMLNAYNSYQIVHAGQQLAMEDGGTTIGSQGFDYVPHFGGANGSQTTGTYVFNATTGGMFAISLVWDVNVAQAAGVAGGTGAFVDNATLYNLNLKLIDVTAGNTMIASSASLVDNTQNIYANISAGHVYDIEVGTTSPAFDWDYGIAWQETAATPEPASAAALITACYFAGTRRPRRKSQIDHHSSRKPR
jgi:hypothetical protein